MLNFFELKQKLPLANSDFGFLRKNGKCYVDKTEYIYQLALDNQPLILTRPRRFGKSTLLSTLEELFLHGVEPYDGHDSYFKGLAIEDKWHDQNQYLVLRLNFQNINRQCKTAAQFEQKLILRISDFCQKQQFVLPEKLLDFSMYLEALLEQLSYGSLVLLVDEYDAPLVRHLNDEAELKAYQELLEALFGLVKDYTEKFRCVFFTGITRFQDLGLGTAGNSFTDISLQSSFGACCGYTREEIRETFAEHLRYAAAVRLGCRAEEITESQIDALLDEMAEWYDGFCFDQHDRSKVFSTWSVLRFFSDADATLTPYWATEEGLGLPQLLKKTMERMDLSKLLNDISKGNIQTEHLRFLQSAVTNPEANPYALLYQAGYLTLNRAFLSNGVMHLAPPNREISIALANLVATRLFRKNFLYTADYALRTVDVLASLDPQRIQAHFNELFAAFPYQNYPVRSESMVAAVIHSFLMGAGLMTCCEQSESRGRSDALIDLKQHKLTIVFEYKYEQSASSEALDTKLNEALKQVKDRDYAHNAHSEPKLARFALVFCGEKSQRRLARVELADIITRPSPDSCSGRVSV